MSAPPLVLALDTSHLTGSVAATRGDAVLCEIVFDASDTHSATFMPAVDACLRTAKSRLADVGLLAVVSGPGSFTGLRIALATAKAFAAAHAIPVTPVGSLEVLAAALPFARGLVLPLIDARRGEVYGAFYDTGSGVPVELVAPFSMRPEDLGRVIDEAGGGRPIVVCGTGAHRFAETVRRLLPPGSGIAGPRWSVPSAAILAHLAAERPPLEPGALSSLEPLYIRPPDARLPDGTKLREGGGA